MTTDGIVATVITSIGIIVAILGIIIGTGKSKKIKLKNVGNVKIKDNSKAYISDIKIANIETHEKSGDK